MDLILRDVRLKRRGGVEVEVEVEVEAVEAMEVMEAEAMEVMEAEVIEVIEVEVEFLDVGIIRYCMMRSNSSIVSNIYKDDVKK
jgi:hypothetical protein